MKIKTVIGVSSRVESFDRKLKEEIDEINKVYDIVNVDVVSLDRNIYGIIGYKRRNNRLKTKKVSDTRTKAEV